MVGINWIADDGSERKPLLFQRVSVRDGRITHIQDYRKRGPALRRS